MKRNTHGLLFRLLHDKEAWNKAKEIVHLPPLDRLRHHNAQKPVLATMAGVFVMLAGSAIAGHAHDLEEWIGVPRLLVDAFGYFTHGCGAVPVMRYIEPVWLILFGE